MPPSNPQQSEIDSLVHLYQDGAFSRRELARRVARITGSPIAAAAALQALGVVAAKRASAQCVAELRVPENAQDLESQMVEFPGPAGVLFAYRASPRNSDSPPRSRSLLVEALPAVLVIHENRGLNDHIKDVTRRVARAGFVGLGIDLLSRLGGTHQFPDPQEAGRAYNRLTNEGILQDMQAAVSYLKSPAAFPPGVRIGPVGVVGFCAGGGNCFNLAVNSPDISAAVVYYGPLPNTFEVLDRLSAPLLCIFGERDRFVNVRMPALVTGLLDRRKPFGLHVYEAANHAFNNDTSPSYDAPAACDAWAKTIAFFSRHLRIAPTG